MGRQCNTCRHFNDNPEQIERTFPGLAILSSGRGSVRAQDGLCDHHGLYLPGNAECADHEAQPGDDTAGTHRGSAS